MTTIIFWDYDGTLVDTEIIYKKSINSFLKENNLLLKEIDSDFFYSNIAGKHPESFLSKLKELGIIKNFQNINPNDIRAYYNTFFKNLKTNSIDVIDNIDIIINQISKNKDIIMCITSSSTKNDFIIKSEKVNNNILNSQFTLDKNIYLCDPSNSLNFKPHPDIFIYAFTNIIKKHNLCLNKNDKLFIVEDSEVGCMAGKEFKIKYGNKIDISIVGYIAGIRYKNYKQDYIDKLINTGANYIIENSNDLLNLINQSKNNKLL